MTTSIRSAFALGLLIVAATALPAIAAPPTAAPQKAVPQPVSPPPAPPAATGVWIDHTGRGAVEISDCGGKLCGHIVWLKDAKNAKGCGIQVLSNVPPVGPATWDGGWIFDPEEDSKYDVELKLVAANQLKVTGYAGLKLLGQTMTWMRAPADITRCTK